MKADFKHEMDSKRSSSSCWQLLATVVTTCDTAYAMITTPCSWPTASCSHGCHPSTASQPSCRKPKSGQIPAAHPRTQYEKSCSQNSQAASMYKQPVCTSSQCVQTAIMSHHLDSVRKSLQPMCTSTRHVQTAIVYHNLNHLCAATLGSAGMPVKLRTGKRLGPQPCCCQARDMCMQVHNWCMIRSGKIRLDDATHGILHESRNIRAFGIPGQSGGSHGTQGPNHP